MTPNEIRQWHNDLYGSTLNPTEVIRARARIEIAAQLAELNENLKLFAAARSKRPLAGRQEQRSVVRRSSFTKTFHVSSWGISSATEDMLRQFIPNEDQPDLEDLEVSQTSVGALGTKTDVMVTRKS